MLLVAVEGKLMTVHVFRATLLDNLRHLQGAPSVQFHNAPKPLYFPEEDEDMRDPDVRVTETEREGRIGRDDEMSDSDEEDGRRDVTIEREEEPEPFIHFEEPIIARLDAPVEPTPPATAPLPDHSSVHSPAAQPIHQVEAPVAVEAAPVIPAPSPVIIADPVPVSAPATTVDVVQEAPKENLPAVVGTVLGAPAEVEPNTAAAVLPEDSMDVDTSQPSDAPTNPANLEQGAPAHEPAV